MNKVKTIILLIMALNSALLMAQINSQKFTQLIGSEPTVEINLGSMMLNLLSSATDAEDKGISSILSALDSINVTVYELEKLNDIMSLRAEISNEAEVKVSSGYQKLATIKEDDSLVYIFAKMDNKKLSSLNIFALDDEDELVIIDINGNIKMSQIGNLMEHFDVDLDINGLKLNKQD